MSNASYVSESQTKISLLPSRLAMKRAALVLALMASVAGAGDFGHYYFTTGRYLQTTDDAYVKADSTINRAESLRLHRRGAGFRQRAGQGWPATGANR